MMSAGSPRSVSKRANASNGDVVSTPPKSQITASSITSRQCERRSWKRLARRPCGGQHRSPLGENRGAGYFCSMKILLLTVTGLALIVCAPAYAIVGGGAPPAEGIGRSVVTIVGSRGNFCSGALIAPKLVLTVAHCVQPGATYKIVEYGTDKQPQLHDVKDVAIHPGFDMAAISAHRATADVALLQLDSPPKGKNAATLGTPQLPLAAGNRFTIAGIGVTIRGEGSSGGTVRVAGLVATGQPGTLQIRLVDPVGKGIRDGLGSCTGDSGGPGFADPPGGGGA